MRDPQETGLDDVLAFLRAFRHQAERYPELVFAERAATRDFVHVEGRTRWVFALEGCAFLAGQVDAVPRLHAAGVRIVGIAHLFHDAFVVPPPGADVPQGPSLLGEESVLSDDGRHLVESLADQGILVDVAHLPEPAFWQVVAITAGRRPIIASHANARRLCNNPRNLTDAQLRAVAATGGLVGVVFHSPLLRCDRADATVDDVLDHIVYMVRLIGEDHVALGSDWEGRTRPPQRLTRPRDAATIASGLRRRGLSGDAIAKIMWRNVARLLDD